MEKTKLLTVAIIALLLLNFGTLGFLIFAPKLRDRGFHHHRPEPKYVIIEKLHFDAKQQRQYFDLITWHRSHITEVEERIHEAKNRLYLHLLKSEKENRTTDSLINLLGDYQKEIEQIHFTHFHDIKQLCKPAQMGDYYDLTSELASIFSKPGKPRS